MVWHHHNSLGKLSDHVGFAMRLALNAVWADVTATLAPFGLKPPSYAALLLIEATPGMKQQNVADALSIQRPNIVALIEDLVARGVVERTVRADDRRSHALTLTPDGAALLARARAAHDEHEVRVANALGEDRTALLRGLWRLEANLRADVVR